MVKVICQYSGIEFEAASKRTKNHPDLADWMQRSNKLGIYNDLMSEISAVRATGSTNLADYKAAWVKVLKADQDMKAAGERLYQENLRKREEAKSAREAQNALLRKHGYTWRKVSDEDIEDGVAHGTAGWQLEASYDGPFSVDIPIARALDEIKRGKDVVHAELRAQIETDKVERARYVAEAAQIEAERVELAERLGQTMEHQSDWSWDDFRYSLGDVIEETEHWVARQYLESVNVIGFVVKPKKIR